MPTSKQRRQMTNWQVFVKQRGDFIVKNQTPNVFLEKVEVSKNVKFRKVRQPFRPLDPFLLISQPFGIIRLESPLPISLPICPHCFFIRFKCVLYSEIKNLKNTNIANILSKLLCNHYYIEKHQMLISTFETLLQRYLRVNTQCYITHE